MTAARAFISSIESVRKKSCSSAVCTCRRHAQARGSADTHDTRRAPHAGHAARRMPHAACRARLQHGGGTVTSFG
jgi:hypothetical protein